MKIEQIHLKKDLDPPALASLAALQPSLVLVFGGVRYFEDPQLGSKLKQLFPQAVIAGCSSAGEIVNDPAVYDDTLVVTAVSAEGSQFFAATAKIAKAEDSRAAGEALGKQLGAGRKLKSVFVLGPGLNVNGSTLAAGLAASLGPDVVVTGGLAGDGGKFQKTWTLCDEAVASDMAVAVGLTSDVLAVTYGSQGGWEAFGLERKVTKAVSNVLFELDGKPALQLYKEYLGDKAKDLPAAGLLYPLSIIGGDSASGGLIRTILNVDEAAGSLILAGDIAEGSVVRLMHAKSDGLVKGAERASMDACAQSAFTGDRLGILVSCVGRKLVMGHDIDEEVEAVKDAFGPHSVITGFYSYGEICAFDRNSKTPRLHNQTMTITCLGRVS